MTKGPEHHSPFGQLEGIGAIIQNDSKVGFIGHLFPSLSNSMNGFFNASFEAATKLICATTLCDPMTSCLDNNFGYEAVPDLTNADGRTSWFLSRAVRRFDMRARMAAQGRMTLENHSVCRATDVRRVALACL